MLAVLEANVRNFGRQSSMFSGIITFVLDFNMAAPMKCSRLVKHGYNLLKCQQKSSTLCCAYFSQYRFPSFAVSNKSVTVFPTVKYYSIILRWTQLRYQNLY